MADIARPPPALEVRVSTSTSPATLLSPYPPNPFIIPRKIPAIVASFTTKAYPLFPLYLR